MFLELLSYKIEEVIVIKAFARQSSFTTATDKHCLYQSDLQSSFSNSQLLVFPKRDIAMKEPQVASFPELPLDKEGSAAQIELQQLNEQLHAVLNAVPGFVSWVNSDGRYLGVNQHLANSLNLSLDTFVGQELGFLQSSSEFEVFMRHFVSSPQAAATQVVSAQINDSTRSYLIAAQKYQQGTRAVAVGVDITERQQAEVALLQMNHELEVRVRERTELLEQKNQQLHREIAHRQECEAALRLREQEFRALVENAPDMILRYDRELRHVYVNPAIESVTGISPQKFIGKTSRELGLPEANVLCWEQVLRQIFATGQELEIEFSYVTPQGLKYYQTRYIPELAADGSTKFVLGICRDITDRQQIEEALRHSAQAARAQVEELEKLSRLKDDFLSTVSHELRTPLTNLKMAISMLQVARTPEKRERYLQILQAECKREINLVNNLLDLQRLEAGIKDVTWETLQLQHWLPQIIEPFYERARAHQQTLKIEISSNLTTVVSDSSKLERVVVELLNNACKYASQEGEITFTAKESAPSNQPNVPARVELIVTNSGPEIPPEQLNRIFEKFYRVPNNDPWRQGGTGLGLALVQKLMELIDGKIWVESRAKKTSFTLSLPTQ